MYHDQKEFICTDDRFAKGATGGCLDQLGEGAARFFEGAGGLPDAFGSTLDDVVYEAMQDLEDWRTQAHGADIARINRNGFITFDSQPGDHCESVYPGDARFVRDTRYYAQYAGVSPQMLRFITQMQVRQAFYVTGLLRTPLVDTLLHALRGQEMFARVAPFGNPGAVVATNLKTGKRDNSFNTMRGIQVKVWVQLPMPGSEVRVFESMPGTWEHASLPPADAKSFLPEGLHAEAAARYCVLELYGTKLCTDHTSVVADALCHAATKPIPG